MLHMLLRMRGLPPKTHESPDGILGAENDDTAREYFESIRISSEFGHLETKTAITNVQKSQYLSPNHCIISTR